jgi:serine protease Do
MQGLERSGGARRAGLVGGGILAVALIGWTPVAAAPAGGYADLVERVAPAVVFIEVTQRVEGAEVAQVMPFGPGTPFDEFLRRFGIPVPEEGMPQAPAEPQERTGVGSGFIIGADGDIVTNNHVVANAEEVSVRLDDGRTFAAEVVGTDPMTDLALLRIEADADLPFVTFGDSATVRPGDNVIAVGNPFGLGGTVTAGIVSAVSRDINAGPYDEFIQIDAAINRGNSGGPLFNEAGEVIGVNTAIFSPNGGSIGIGFAVPSNVAEEVIAEIDANGTVERGWLGVQLQPLTGDIADALGLASEEGALVASVLPESPAASAGIEAGDVILRFAGAEVADQRQLARLVAAEDTGATVPVEVWRGGEAVTLEVTVAPLESRDAAAGAPEATSPGESEAPRLGLSVAPLTEETRAMAGIGEEVQGVVVTAVDPSGPAAGEIRAGDVIVSVQNAPVTSPEALADAVRDAERDAILLRVARGGEERFVALRPAAS